MYTIYHIPGEKVGCTVDFTQRIRQYPKGTIFEILEEFGDHIGDKSAGDVEWFYADMYGYKRGPHYSKSNWSITGANTVRHICSNETRKKMSQSRLGHAFSTTHKENISKGRKGLKLSDNHKEYISKSWSDERRATASVRMKLRNQMSKGRGLQNDQVQLPPTSAKDSGAQ